MHARGSVESGISSLIMANNVFPPETLKYLEKPVLHLLRFHPLGSLTLKILKAIDVF